MNSKYNLLMNDEQFGKFVEIFKKYLKEGLKGQIENGFYGSKINLKQEIKSGNYAVLDIGGSLIRYGEISIDKGSGKFNYFLRNFKQSEQLHLFINNSESFEDFFTKIVDWLPETLKNFDKVGFCFSYPIEPVGDHDAILKDTSKNLNRKDFLGKKLGRELTIKLQEKFGHKYSSIVLNDSTAGLLAGRTQVENPMLLLIVGTGYNVAFKNNGGEIINSECGHWDMKDKNGEIDGLIRKFSHTGIDFEGIDDFEAQVSGRFLSMIYSVIKSELNFSGNFLILNSEDMSDLIQNGAPHGGMTETKEKELAVEIVQRSAQLVSAQLCGFVDLLNMENLSEVDIVVDGSVFWKMKDYKESVNRYVDKYFGKDVKLNFVKVESPTLVGAGIAAGMYL